MVANRYSQPTHQDCPESTLSIHPRMRHGHGPGWELKYVPEIYATATLPEGCTHFYLNLTDDGGCIVSPNVVAVE